PAPSVSRRRRVASMISGPMPSPRMTVIRCVTLLFLVCSDKPLTDPAACTFLSGQSKQAAYYRCCDGLTSHRVHAVGGSPTQHAIERAFLLERIEVVETTDMLIADEDLRHRATPA